MGKREGRNMQLVIDISEDDYKTILLTGKASFSVVNAIEAGRNNHGKVL